MPTAPGNLTDAPRSITTSIDNYISENLPATIAKSETLFAQFRSYHGIGDLPPGRFSTIGKQGLRIHLTYGMWNENFFFDIREKNVLLVMYIGMMTIPHDINFIRQFRMRVPQAFITALVCPCHKEDKVDLLVNADSSEKLVDVIIETSKCSGSQEMECILKHILDKWPHELI